MIFCFGKGLWPFAVCFYFPAIASRDVTGDGILALRGQLGGALGGDDGHNVRVHAEACAGHFQVVGHDHVHVLLLQLGRAVFNQVAGLHREAADKQLFRLMRTDPG